jgi:ketosteroid isomerase-like protein
MHRNDIEAALRAAYAARAANDAAQSARIFGPKATFRGAGDPAFCGAVATYAGPALPPALEKLCEVFHASAFTVTSMIIDGDRAAVRCDATFKYAPTGEAVSLELAHYWTFKDGHAIELVEFFDTAHVAHIMAKAPSQPAG